MAENRRRVLAFRDDPMFKRVMEREDICKGVLQRVLGRPIGRVQYHNTEQEHRASIDGKSIRMDAYLVESGGRLYDVEMQVAFNPALCMRFRGYQSLLDASMLKRGERYDQLKESYLIFICVADPFGRGLPVYSIEPRCLEDGLIEIKSRQHWVALNASAYDRVEGDEGLRALLQYVATGVVPDGDGLLESIDAEVDRYNADKRVVGMMLDTLTTVRQEAMVLGRAEGLEEGIEQGRAEGLEQGIEQGRAEGLEEGLEQGRAEGLEQGIEQGRAEGRELGLEQGRAEGEERYSKLIAMLLGEGRTDDLARANCDLQYRQLLYGQYGI